MKLAAAAMLLVLLSPLAGIAAECGCSPNACLLHQPRSAPAGHTCHEAPPQSGPSCALVAPCRHSSGATPVLALPPAILSAATVVPAPSSRDGAVSTARAVRLRLPSRISTPPPRFPTA